MKWKRTRHSKYKDGLSASDIIVAVIVICLAVYLAWPTREKAQLDGTNSNSITGYAIINDGDSLTINGKKIRLLGVDAPELHQFCGEKNQQYACGREAKNQLEKLVSNKKLECLWDKNDRFGRLLAVCLLDNEPINATMVREGWAVSYYDYPQEEKEAKANKNGIWKAPFEWPRNWRKSHPR